MTPLTDGRGDTLTVFDCPHCGRHIGEIVHHYSCPHVATERTYVAVDALLSDEAVEAAFRVAWQRADSAREPSRDNVRATLRAAVEDVGGQA